MSRLVYLSAHLSACGHNAEVLFVCLCDEQNALVTQVAKLKALVVQSSIAVKVYHIITGSSLCVLWLICVIGVCSMSVGVASGGGSAGASAARHTHTLGQCL